MIESGPRTAARWRTSDVKVVVPLQMARTMWSRATRLDVGLGGRYLAERDQIQVWSDDANAPDPIGAFSVQWRAPSQDAATLHTIAWDPQKGSEVAVRRAMRRLAARIGDRTSRRNLLAGAV